MVLSFWQTKVKSSIAVHYKCFMRILSYFNFSYKKDQALNLLGPWRSKTSFFTGTISYKGKGMAFLMTIKWKFNKQAKHCHKIIKGNNDNKQYLTRTQSLVWLVRENRSGKQLERSSETCQPESDERKSIEGKDVFNSSVNLLRLGRFGREGRQFKSTERMLCRSALLRKSGKWWNEWRSTTSGTLLAVYMVSDRNRKKPIKCLKEVPTSFEIQIITKCKMQAGPTQYWQERIANHYTINNRVRKCCQFSRYTPYVQTLRVSLWMVKMLKITCFKGHSDR